MRTLSETMSKELDELRDAPVFSSLMGCITDIIIAADDCERRREVPNTGDTLVMIEFLCRSAGVGRSIVLPVKGLSRIFSTIGCVVSGCHGCDDEECNGRADT